MKQYRGWPMLAKKKVNYEVNYHGWATELMSCSHVHNSMFAAAFFLLLSVYFTAELHMWVFLFPHHRPHAEEGLKIKQGSVRKQTM